MARKIDLTGKVFGRLTVIRKSNIKKYNHVFYECVCDCGKTKIIDANDLRKGNTVSCGCKRIENNLKINGLSNTRLYRIYIGIKGRCYCKTNSVYKNYGNRGITMCDEWKNNFISFYNWAVQNGYSDNLTIDRINYNGNYEPSNCRWVTIQEQQNNKVTNHLITIGNKTQNLMQWSKQYNINYSVLKYRIKKGIKGEDLLKPIDTRYSHKKRV